MANTYKCGTCGVITEEQSHLCHPQEISGKGDYCGQSIDAAETMCQPMLESLEYECSTCGRPAEKSEMICKPVKLR